MQTNPQQTDHHHNKRVLTVARLAIILFLITFTAVLARVAQLQLQPEPQVAEILDQRLGTQPIMARRGALLDSRGRELAVSRVGYKLFVDPSLVDDPIRFAAQLGYAINLDPAQIDMLMDVPPSRRYVVLHPLLTEQQVQTVRALKLPGIGLEKRLERIYPHNLLARHLIGYIGAEHQGLEGVEFALDKHLAGKPGLIKILRDVRRRPLWVEQSNYVPARHGMNIQLSIDTEIQRIAYEELETACKKYKAKRAEVVLMDPITGQVLAMVNWPRHDPELDKQLDENGKPVHKIDPAIKRNRCVTDAYEPGSVFKPFMHAAATAARVVQKGQIVDTTTSGVWVVPRVGRRLRDAHPHGAVSWEKVLIFSSNIGMGKICSKMGNKKLHAAVKKFGFAGPSGIALPGESPGLLFPVKKWSGYSNTSIPMGQEIAVTAVQMARALSVFANEGLMVAPSVLHGEEPVYQRVIDPSTALYTRKLMRRVVLEGTGKRAQSDLYEIWGKTGTAQVPDLVKGGYKHRTYTASFVFGAPLKNPRIVGIVSVHEPDPNIGYYGGVVSAPVAKNIIEKSLTYLAIPPLPKSNRSIARP